MRGSGDEVRSVPHILSHAIFIVLVLAVTAACESQRVAYSSEDIGNSIVRIAGTACLKPILATGFVVSTGTVVTVAHGIAGVESDLHVVDNAGTRYEVEVVDFDDQLDLAVLTVEGFSGEALNQAEAGQGDTGVIAAMDSDVGVVLVEYEVLRIVTARSGDIYDNGHVERAAIDIRSDAGHGTSGAPLLNDEGNYVGMVFAISRERNDGVYALASFEIADLLASPPTGLVSDIGRCR